MKKVVPVRDLHSPTPETVTDRYAIWQPGATVGRYNLLTRLAVGGMAEIWLARQAGLQGFEKFVAIKRIIDALSEDADFVGMFLDEARLAAQLNHPHIVQIYDLGEQEGAYYIAMEYLPGENLASLLRACSRQKKTLPLAHAVRIIADAAEGLAYAHAKLGPDGALLGVVHRDVSPQNILVTYDGVVKVLDFGIAKAATRESQTVVGQVRGKAAYMSPEQARGQTLDARSDIFSLGIVLFELVTGTRLFPEADPLVAMSMLAGDEEPLPLAHERNGRVPESLGRVIARALERHPSQRYLSARHFQAALEEWLRGLPEVPDSTELASYMTQMFGERIQERARLVESARSGELTPSSARQVVGRLQTSNSIQARLNTRELTVEQPPPAPPRRWPLLAGAAALVLLVGIGGFFALRPSPVVPRPVAPAVPRVEAPPAPPVLTIETDPSGARISVDGHELGDSPLTSDMLALGEHSVTAALEGHQPQVRQVKLTYPGERTTVVLALPALPVAPPPAPPDTAAAAPENSGTTTRVPRRMGKLTLDTNPWTVVYLRGRKLGDTPLIDYALPVGRYQLRLVNEGSNLSTTIEVEIRAGQLTTKKLRL